jgi:ribosomal protein L15
MNLSNQLRVQRTVKIRLGRGEGSGKGGTSSRGHNGQKSRSGYSKRLVLKEGKCHFKDVFLSSVLQTSIVR